MTAIELWTEYCNKSMICTDMSYSAWQFGDDADQLAYLVYTGKKTATSSLFAIYERLPDEPLPQEGDISIVLDQHEQAVCIIQNTKVYKVPFCDISPEHARKEGEGDLSLCYWRKVHDAFFRSEAVQNGLIFNESSLILCEEFKVLYKSSEFITKKQSL